MCSFHAPQSDNFYNNYSEHTLGSHHNVGYAAMLLFPGKSQLIMTLEAILLEFSSQRKLEGSYDHHDLYEKKAETSPSGYTLPQSTDGWEECSSSQSGCNSSSRSGFEHTVMA